MFHYSFHINVDGWPFACRSKDSDDRWANRVCPSCPNWTKLMNRMGYWHFDKETCLVSIDCFSHDDDDDDDDDIDDYEDYSLDGFAAFPRVWPLLPQRVQALLCLLQVRYSLFHTITYSSSSIANTTTPTPTLIPTLHFRYYHSNIYAYTLRSTEK